MSYEPHRVGAPAPVVQSSDPSAAAPETAQPTPAGRRANARSSRAPATVLTVAAPATSSLEPVLLRRIYAPTQRSLRRTADVLSPEPQGRRTRMREHAVYPPVAMLQLPPPPPRPIGLGLLGIAGLPENEPRNIESRAAFDQMAALHQNARPFQRRREDVRREEAQRAPHPHGPWVGLWPDGPERDRVLARAGWAPEALRVAFGDHDLLSEEYVSVSPQVEQEREQEAMEMRALILQQNVASLTLDERERASSQWSRIQPYRPWEREGDQGL